MTYFPSDKFGNLPCTITQHSEIHGVLGKKGAEEREKKKENKVRLVKIDPVKCN